MVWFQCEDCGENLKKPKLAAHFRACSAQQLSCIDCGVVFNQQSVQGHTQCVSEAEKYGPKNMGCIKKETMKSVSKESNFDGLDINLGLSTRAPWSCSLCNVKATSQETLMLHSQGKKHRSKVRATSSKKLNGTLASNDKLGGTVLPVDGKLDLNGHISKISSNDGSSKIDPHNFERENGIFSKVSAQPDDGPRQHNGANPDAHSERQHKRRKIDTEQDSPASGERRGEECPQNQTEAGFSSMGARLSELSGCGKYSDGRSKGKQKKHLVGEDVVQEWASLVKWKKIIRRTLKGAPSGSLKMKRLQSSFFPVVMETTRTSGLEVSEETFSIELRKQIQSHATFIIDGKRVRLADKSQAMA